MAKFFSVSNSFRIVLAICAMSATAQAAPTSSWGTSSSPSWMNGIENRDAASPQARRSVMREDSKRATNPPPFTPGSNNISLDVGQVFLMGDLGSNYSDSIGAQVHYTYGVSDLFGFDASAGYSGHSEGKFSMTTLLAGLRTNLAWFDRVIPYAVFGLGFYRPSYQHAFLDGTSMSVNPVLFGIHLGPGVDLQLTRQLFFGASLTFHDMFGSTQVTAKGPLSVGGTYTTFLIHAGFSF